MTPTAPVTVVVPAYNAAAYLAVTLQSLQQQTQVPEQVVVMPVICDCTAVVMSE